MAPFGESGTLSRTFKTAVDNYVGTTRFTSSGEVAWQGIVMAPVFRTANFQLGGIKDSYTDFNNNIMWQEGWKYSGAGPANLLRFGSPGTKKSDFIFYAAPSNGTSGTNAAVTEVMRICENGSVGIGTDFPGSFKLAVEGTLGARKIKVSQAGWADFVFHPDYPLASLDSVAHFIKVNRHLPDIPAEKEVLAEGIDVGEMNKKLLQKIEELTLYLIESRKEYRSAIEELRKENEALKSKIDNTK